MNKKELREILEKHKKWLNNEEGGKRADLSAADLSNADLSAADLRYADLSYADLSYADLSYADLSAADLSAADLSHADLSAADLSYADLSAADLSHANLDYSVLPLWCGSVKTHFDDKQIIQFIYYTTKAGLYSKNVSTEIKEELKKLAPLANKFHRVEECGKISTENNQPGGENIG